MSLVSIIVPVYNAAAYLEKCLKALLAQSFQDFELILVDDGSKDDSGSICDKYAASDNRIKVIHKENGGVSSARNMGLDAAQGKYIMFCDSDDYIYPDFCSPLVELAEGLGDCLVLAGVTTIQDNGKTRDLLVPDVPQGDTLHLSLQEFCDLYVELNLTGEFSLLNMPYNKLFSRKIIEDNHIRYNTAVHYNEDFIFNLDYLDKVSEVLVYNAPIYNYYLDAPGSLCKRYFKDIDEMFRLKEDRAKAVIFDKATDRKASHKVWCTLVFNDANRIINNTFSPQNSASDKEKTRYCTKLIRSKRFQEALRGTNTKGYNKLYLKALKLRSFGLIRLLKKF